MHYSDLIMKIKTNLINLNFNGLNQRQSKLDS